MLYLLQTTTTIPPERAEQIASRFSPDSLRNDTARVIEYVTTTQPGQMINDLLSAALSFGLKVLAALAIYLIGAWLTRLLKKALNKTFTRKNTDAALASFINSLISICATILIVILAISALGVNTSSLAALLAAGGLALGMALSGTLQNFAGGIMLMLFKPFKAGDYIKAQDHEGFVTEMTIVSTKIRTYDNRIIILPNGILSNGTIDNYSQSCRRIDWKIQVGYGTDFDKAKEVLYGILSEDERILDDTTPGAGKPSVIFSAFRDSSIEIAARCWVKMEDYWGVKYSVNEKIYKRLPENGIAFPFPQLDVHVK